MEAFSSEKTVATTPIPSSVGTVGRRDLMWSLIGTRP
jgi:hypothetical protein